MSGRGGRADVEVIIPCKNEAGHLRECLEAVLAQNFAGSFSVMVIDSGSIDGSVEIARSLPVRLIEIAPSEFHHARTRNLGAERAQAPVLVYLNGDAVPVGNDWLTKLTAPLRGEGRKDVAGVYGRQLPRDDAYPMERFMLSRLYGKVPRLQRVERGQPMALDRTLFSTVNCALRRDLWRERPFSDEVTMSEDQEWSRYWLGRGYAIAYEPEAAVVHSHNNSLSRVFRRYYDSGVSSEASYLPRGGRASSLFALSGVRYLAEEALFVARAGYARWLPFAAAYESLKVAGLVLGRHHRWLPAHLKQRMTYFG